MEKDKNPSQKKSIMILFIFIFCPLCLFIFTIDEYVSYERFSVTIFSVKRCYVN